MVVEKGTVGGVGDLYGSYANNAEWIVFCQKGRRLFNPTNLLENRKKECPGSRGRKAIKRYKTRHNACWFGSEYPKATYNSVWQKKNHIFHPTIKNAECLSWLIQISSLPEELVFDGFMGTGRHYLGAEIKPEYFEVAKRKVKEAVSEKADEG